MDQSFADRLARIQSSGASVAVPGGRDAELIGQTNRNALPSMQELYPTHTPQTYDQRFKMAILNYLILGFIWMGATGFIAANFFVTAEFLAGAAPTEDSLRNIKWGLGVALITSFGLCYWVIKQAIRDVGKVHGMPGSLAIGCVLGTLAGAGPVTIFNLLVETGYL